MDAITLAIGALVTARLTRLITRDQILHPVRRRLILRWGMDSMLSYLITCDWCVSIWMGAAVATVGAETGLWPRWAAIPLCLAYSYVAGYLASREGE